MLEMIEDQHFIVAKDKVSLRFDNQGELQQYILNCDEQYGVFVVTTQNITDQILAWKEANKPKDANNNTSVV